MKMRGYHFVFYTGTVAQVLQNQISPYYWYVENGASSLMIASKLISAIPARVCVRYYCCNVSLFLFRNFTADISPSPSDQQPLSSLHLREFTRIYEMLELGVTYSRSRVVSTSWSGIKKEKKNRKRKERRERGRTSPALTIFSSWGRGGGITAVHVYTVINFHDPAHNPARNFLLRSSPPFPLFFLFPSPPSFLSTVLSVRFATLFASPLNKCDNMSKDSKDYKNDEP